MVYVYAQTAHEAVQWALGEGLRRREFRAFGAQSRTMESVRFTGGDRIVVVGVLNRPMAAVLEHQHRKSGGVPSIERLPGR